MKMNKFFHLAKILSRKKIKANSWSLEKKLLQKHRNLLAIDEAGRGALAGPLVIGSLFLDKKTLKILEKEKVSFFDSKILNSQQRIYFRKIIQKLGLPHKIIFVSHKKIDKWGINQAFLWGIKKILAFFQPKAVVFDGLEIKNLNFKNSYFFVKGDQKLPSLGAASILAKTSRDKYMINISKKYPEYQFNLHKGYGTKKHFFLIKKYKLSKIHRQGFVKIK